MRKKVDERIRTLIENGVKTRHRSMFFIIGDKSRDQIVNLHYMLTKAVVKSRPSVLWCYKDKLELSSHKKKRAKQVKKLMQRGLLDPEKVDPFSLFVETGGITYCLYKDSERVLGNTFGMCILQDFEALTPNLLARTIETVEGGGLIILLLRSLSSLTSLCTMVMDVHERFRTESHSEATGRFNERFLLSIASCKACVVMDDELNILPISSHMKSIKPFSVNEDSEGLSEAERDLKNLKEQLNDDFPVGPLIRKCCTLDQPSVRKQHNAGYKHKANVRTYYQQLEAQQNQSLIDQKIKEHLGQTTAYQQVGAAYNALRPRVPILPTPMMPMAGNTQLPVNSPLIPGARPPVLPRPLPGYMSAPVMPPMVGPPGAAALPGRIANLPRPPPMGAPSAVPGTTMTPASVSTSMVTPAMYQAANSAPPTSGGFDSFNVSAQAPEADH